MIEQRVKRFDTVFAETMQDLMIVLSASVNQGKNDILQKGDLLKKNGNLK